MSFTNNKLTDEMSFLASNIGTLAAFCEWHALNASKISDAARDGAIEVMQAYGFDSTVDAQDEPARAMIQTILEVGYMAGFGAAVAHFKERLAEMDRAVEATTQIELEDREPSAYYKRGYEAGKARASWVTDGNTSAETAQAILDALESCEYDFPPSPLSGCWADERTCPGLDDEDAADFEDGYTVGFEEELTRACKAIIGDVDDEPTKLPLTKQQQAWFDAYTNPR